MENRPGMGPLSAKSWAIGDLSREVLRYAAYPILALSAVWLFASTLHYGWDRGQSVQFFLVGVILYLAALERVIPHRDDWHPTGREICWYAAYFVFTMAGAVLAQAVVGAVVAAVRGPGLGLALRTQIPVALLTSSLAGYLAHRLAHSHRWLWRVHGIHHVPAKVNVANNGVNHVLDVGFKQGAVQLSLGLAGFSPDCLFAVALFTLVQGYFVHANIDVRLGPFQQVLASPEQHRLHHSADVAEAGHYGVDLAIWDRLFRSFTWRPGREPDVVGVHDPAAFPETGSVLAGLLHPWRRSARTA
ncbi:sterol desaturase family protein [Streptomyces sp. SP18ES09]|uniref:sterol desaturase family protein n=1 Tax=Streptomyces sp. SP18ES09 TaxID=3002532 RepID=UPI002E79D650|nr:sterol desaturase family protein [Streptomyces sp. SP18ES09]MEE1820200.1 sterol desaturase family protein [Streptomyces sp. SP18ES09]